MLTAKELYNTVFSKIITLYDKQEASALTFLILEYFGISKTDVITNKFLSKSVDFKPVLERLSNHEPIQYIFHEAWFYGRKFFVDKNVLIPRPETEELCRLVLENLKNTEYKILDIGTGSGCIPITLKLENPQLNIHALDVSDGALLVAQKNAAKLNADVHFFNTDILTENPDFSFYDVIISNPPYITRNEIELMKKNVIDYEPHIALFVENNDPLLFYRKISHLAALGNVKKIFFEVNKNYADEVCRLLKKEGYGNAQIKTDHQGKKRMVWGNLSR